MLIPRKIYYKMHNVIFQEGVEYFEIEDLTYLFGVGFYGVLHVPHKINEDVTFSC